jgi:AbrB family looped-hinge helix DNA binding protein
MPKLTTGERATIPRRIRVALGLKPGDRVDFVKMETANF